MAKQRRNRRAYRQLLDHVHNNDISPLLEVNSELEKPGETGETGEKPGQTDIFPIFDERNGRSRALDR
jgi:hypothetical protein